VAWGAAVLALQLFHLYLAAQIRSIGFEAMAILSPLTWIIAIIIAILLLFGIRVLVLRTMREKYL
jgi:hypothetical protein